MLNNLPTFSDTMVLVSIFSTAGLGIVAIWLGFSYHKLSDQLKHLQKDEKRNKTSARHKAGKIVEEAKEHSLELLEQAQDKAAEMILETDVATEGTQKKLHEGLEHALQEQKTAYNQALEHMRQDTINILSTISEDIKKQALSEVDTFRKTLQEEVLQAQASVREKVAGQYEQVEKQTHAYRDDLMRKVDSSIYSVIERITQEVLQKSITKKDHEDIVRELFEKAQKQLKTNTESV